eukprot:941800-Ditylum_brightwellii.AAC.1
MLIAANLRKHHKRNDVERGSGFDPPDIPFTPKATTLKMDNAQDFNLHVMPASKQLTYKFEAYTFLNGTEDNILE